MSYFLCVSLPYKIEKIEKFFPTIQCKDISQTPFGIVAGVHKNSISYLLLKGGCSTDILNKGYKKTYCSKIFITGVCDLLNYLPTLSFVIHIARGNIFTEKFSLAGKEKIPLNVFEELFPLHKLDIRYIVTPPVKKIICVKKRQKIGNVDVF